MFADQADEVGHGKDHVAGVALLLHDAVHLEPQLRVLRVRDLVLRDEAANRTGRVESLRN